jgi:hypothetical protein
VGSGVRLTSHSAPYVGLSCRAEASNNPADMSVRVRAILIIVLIAAALSSAGAYAYWHFLLRGPFAGETFHDFGDVALHEETAEVQHTFHLVNRLNRPLTVVAIRPECGCLTTRDIKPTLEPGEAFELPITLIAKGGERSVVIHIIFDDDSRAALRVKATGRYQPRLSAPQASMALAPDGTAEIALMLQTYDTYDEPVAPTIETSNPMLHAEFMTGAGASGWTMKYRPRPADMAIAPTEWQGRVRVRLDDGTAPLADSASVTLAFPNARPLRISIRPPE